MKDYLRKIEMLIALFFTISFFSTASFAAVDYTVISDWGSGFQGQFTINNTTSLPYSDVSLEFDFPYTITSVWDASFARNGNSYSIKLPSWKTSIAPGEKYSFGFIAQPGNATAKLSNIKFNGASVDPSSFDPTAVNDIANTNANTSVLINPLSKSKNPNGYAMFLAAISQPSHGTAVQNGDSVTYIPAKDYIGTDSFNFTIANDKGGKSSAKITISVKESSSPSEMYPEWSASETYIGGDKVSYNGHNYEAKWWTQGENPANSGQWGVWKDIGQSKPSENKVAASNFSYSVDQNEPVVIDVLKYASGTELTISKVSSPNHGTAVIENSKVTYSPVEGYNGSDTFEYTVKDSIGQEASALVSIIVNKPDAPIAENITVSVQMNKTLTIDVLSHAQSEQTPLAIASITKPENGSAQISNGKVIYTTADGFTGQDTFSYTVKDSLNLTATALVTVFVNSQVASDKVNATYWCLWGGNTSYNIGGKQIVSHAIDLDKIDSSYNILIVAFIITDSNGNLYLAYDMNNPAHQQGLYNPDQVKGFIAIAKAEGRKVIVSLGGEKFHLSLKTEAQKELFISQAEKIINEYGFDGLDLDMEAGSFSSDPALLGQAVNKIVSEYRNSGKTFYLTAAPEWCYIVPFAWGSGQWASHSLAGDFYMNIINTIGLSNFSYIWPQLYNQGSANGIIGKGNVRVTPADGMDKFMAAMTWAATTQEGYQANGSMGLLIPSDKFALGIPATEGAAGGEMAYIATPSLISSAVNMVKSQGGDLAGFMNWSVDWDALKITDGQLTPGYTHEAWDTGRAVASALNLNPVPLPQDDDNTAPTINFTSLWDGQTITLKSLSAIDLSVAFSDKNLSSSSITVEGVTYDGNSVSWTPSAFGTYRIIAYAEDSSGNCSTKNITVAVVQDTDHQEPPISSRKQIVGYITQWDAWKGESFGLPAKGVFNQLNVDYSKYTILNYSFSGLAKDGSLHSADFRNKAMTANNPSANQDPAPMLDDDIYSSWDMWLLYGDVQYNWSTSPAKIEKVARGAPGLFDLCKKNNVKLMASIGGWSMSKHFSEMANSQSLKANFLKDVQKLMDMGFDGIDIDWEYPGAVGMNFTGNAYDYDNYASLMRDIRATIGADKLITGAFSAAPNNLNGFDWEQLSAYMDYFNIMSYDLEGGWSDTAGHNSALYGNKDAACWDNTFKFLTQTKGVKPEKINMGVASYGRGVETLSDATLGGKTKKSQKSFSVDGSLKSAADFANWGLFEGVPNYAYIISNTAPSTGWVYHWDEEEKVPYMTKDYYFLSFDNPESVGLKADYVNNNNAAGVIIWQVFGDMQFEEGVSYVNPSIKKLPKADKVTTPLLNVLHKKMNK
ncbi:MAG: hypothetical protein A2X47_01010 [Lentisphaerae bacterium GWF2_38_69]|nr:MAG: hypothetical protein A2X47_01010 [Lentisphaerae bacterium GWF2_38_69]